MGQPEDLGALERRISEAEDVNPQKTVSDPDDLTSRPHEEFVIRRPYERTFAPAFFGISDKKLQRSPFYGEIGGDDKAIDTLADSHLQRERMEMREDLGERSLIQMQELRRAYPGAICIGRHYGQVVLFRKPIETQGTDTYVPSARYIMLTSEGWMAVGFPRALDPETRMRSGKVVSEVVPNGEQERKFQEAIARAAENPMDHPLEGWKVLEEQERELSIAGFKIKIFLDGIHNSLATKEEVSQALEQEERRYEHETFLSENDRRSLEVLNAAEEFIYRRLKRINGGDIGSLPADV